MPSSNHTARDFGKAVQARLKQRRKKAPPLNAIVELFEILFAASLKTEEGQSITCHITYLDPKNPDPTPPERIVRNRWICVPFADTIPLTVANVAKLAKATDPRTSSFAIYHKADGSLEIWGLVDQGNQYHEFINYEANSAYPRPGVFQAGIYGLGHLIAFNGLERIAELKVNTLVTRIHDVLTEGPVAAALRPAFYTLSASVEKDAPKLYAADVAWCNVLLYEYLIETISRILMRIRGHRHGGALLITPDKTLRHISVKFKIDYSRLKTALKNHAISQMEEGHASDIISNDYFDTDADIIPMKLYLDESIAAANGRDSKAEIDGIVWFVSLLSRVDGAIVLAPDLTVRGFGAELTCHDEPQAVFRAGDAAATPKSLRQFNFQQFGTRHRSMMRYCNEVPGSLGFVVSQDGDVRAFTRVGEKLVMWENIKLQRLR
jgi:hypothetical protein